MKRGLMLSLAATAMMAVGTGVRADTFDASLASPNSISSTPGYYNGNGGINGGFTVTEQGGIELGLRASLRFPPPSSSNVIDSPTNDYVVPGGLHDAGHANWNYDFSIDLRPNGLGSGTIGDISANTVLIVEDLTTGQSNSLNPLTTWTDNNGFGTGGKDTSATSTDWGAQNSQNPQFSQFALNGISANFFQNHAYDNYRFTLEVRDAGNTLLASDSIDVTSTPLPPVLWAGLALMGCVGVATRLKRRQGVLA